MRTVLTALPLLVLACGASRSVIEPPLKPAEVTAEPTLDAVNDGGAQVTLAGGRAMTIPELAEVDASIVRQLHTPPGFTVSIFATGVDNARVIAVERTTGRIYVTSPRTDSVYVLEDRHGTAGPARIAIKGLEQVHGIAIRGDHVWLAGAKEIWTAPIAKDGTFGTPKVIVRDLPEGGQHPNRTLGFDPTGRLYVSIGSACNACAVDNPEHATIISMKPDGSDRRIYARGLRHTVGFDWDPKTGQLWGVDHGSDGRDPEPPDELNQIVEGGNYGWPYAFGKKQPDPLMEAPGKMDKDELVEHSVGSILEFPAHSSPAGMIFYRGKQFPADYQGDAFIAFRGPRSRIPPVGYKVMRVHFENGKPTGASDFLTGFSDAEKVYGRLAGLEITNDGALLVADQRHGIIYRVGRAEVFEARN